MRDPIPPDEYAPFDSAPRRAPQPAPVLQPPPHLPDPHGMATKHMHVKLNPWELEQVSRLARRECMPMTGYVRRVLRAHLFAEMKR